MNRRQAATAILAAQKHNPPFPLVLTEPTDDEWETAKAKARREHPTREVKAIRVKYV